MSVVIIFLAIFGISLVFYIVNKLNSLIVNSIRDFFGMFNNIYSDIIIIILIGLRSFNRYYSSQVISNSGICYFAGSFMTADCLIVDYKEAEINASMEFISLMAFALLIGLCRTTFVNKLILSFSVILYMVAYVYHHYHRSISSEGGLIFFFYEALVNLLIHQYSVYFKLPIWYTYTMYPTSN